LIVNNDNTIKPLRDTLRRWSQFAMSGKLFRYSKSKEAYLVSSQIDDINESFGDIIRLFGRKVEKLSESEIEEIISTAST